MSNIDKVSALFESGSPRKWPVFASFSNNTKIIVPNQDLHHDNLSISTKLTWSKNVYEYGQAP